MTLRRTGAFGIAAAVVICAAGVFAVWEFVAVPRLYWDERSLAPHGICQQLLVVLDDTWQESRPSEQLDSNFLQLALESREIDPSCFVYMQGIGAGRSQVSKAFSAVFGLGSREARDSAYLRILEKANESTRLVILGSGTGALNALMLSHTIEQAGLSSTVASIDRRTGLPRRLTFAAPRTPIRVAFLGLCDMTAAWFSPIQSHFAHDVPAIGVPPSVDRTVHLLALDEHRGFFSPIHINNTGSAREVWFAGTHSDVCGGNYNQALNALSRQYIRDQMRQQGLMVRAVESDLDPLARRVIRAQAQGADRDVFVVESYGRSQSAPLVHQSVEGLTRNHRLPKEHVVVNSDYKLFQR